ncbi:putative phage associated protein [Neisseria meningitidis alpha14]|uniref:Putative phage associated protein n=1 Tax=Neisseria meningitidis (strain alpha14) TaxID=662598 RepID=C6S6R9_NEIML|nr:putative phage associated protein [Neisseria meningitidis alpha14]
MGLSIIVYGRLPSGGRHSRKSGNPVTEKPQESIGKNRNPTAVIPAQAGIQKRNATGIYRKKQKPPPRHSRAGGNPKTQRNRNLSEKTETPTASFPRRRESRNTTRQDFIGKNRNPTDRHSRKSGNPKTQRNRNPSEKTETPPTVIPAKAGIQKRNATGIYRKKQKPHRRHSRKSGNPATEKPQESISKNRNPTAVIPAKAGIQTRRHGILPDKTVSLDSTS